MDGRTLLLCFLLVFVGAASTFAAFVPATYSTIVLNQNVAAQVFQGSSNYYLFNVSSSNTYSVTLTPSCADPDLYVYSTASFVAGVPMVFICSSIQPQTSVDSCQFTASSSASSGVYYFIRIYGYGTCDVYTLKISVAGGGGGLSPGVVWAIIVGSVIGGLMLIVVIAVCLTHRGLSERCCCCFVRGRQTPEQRQRDDSDYGVAMRSAPAASGAGFNMRSSSSGPPPSIFGPGPYGAGPYGAFSPQPSTIITVPPFAPSIPTAPDYVLGVPAASVSLPAVTPGAGTVWPTSVVQDGVVYSTPPLPPGLVPPNFQALEAGGYERVEIFVCVDSSSFMQSQQKIVKRTLSRLVQQAAQRAGSANLRVVSCSDGQAQILEPLNTTTVKKSVKSISWVGQPTLLPGWHRMMEMYESSCATLGSRPLMLALFLTGGVPFDNHEFMAQLISQCLNACVCFVLLDSTALATYGQLHVLPNVRVYSLSSSNVDEVVSALVSSVAPRRYATQY
eukprot:gnl/Spiro4/18159_TR9694_c0_g1_i1.p1 gnl/Spiro4/18159_TR9694_c0_g1~~gnl/Spiro4/18159_TR9694_c0_g1_i1.p1  ORF type:complete len:514 (+),score=37.35 gnl/Spiro4/18159_TR9694_c0_g1_i1:32-1543(+)